MEFAFGFELLESESPFPFSSLLENIYIPFVNIPLGYLCLCLVMF